MSRHDWFRNTDWNAQVSAEFEAKLARSRKKEQYLRIQAGTLAEGHPSVAHALLDRYFELTDQFDAAQAHVERATAFLAQGNVDEALLAYDRALAREIEFPHLRTQAYLQLPFEIATRSLKGNFPRALEVLEQHKGELMFAVDYFKWNASQALIAAALDDGSDPVPYARAALEAADRDHSGFRYHPGVGLVSTSLSEVRTRMQQLCEA